MAEEGGAYVLDDPTSGLHLADVDHLLDLLDRLAGSGKSVIFIEHHQAVMAHADWIIDLGPDAGHDGGRIVCTSDQNWKPVTDPQYNKSTTVDAPKP